MEVSHERTKAMTQAITRSVESHNVNNAEIFYPSEDGEPLAETSLHADAIIAIVTMLRNYLAIAFGDRSPVVLADQFLYYAQGFPRLRVAPDVMVIFDIPQVPYDNYKIWEFGRVPSVVFEISSAGTQTQDREYKKTLYESLGICEYWLFDPKGEWIAEKLRGYQLLQHDSEQDPRYEAIVDRCSNELGLRLEVEGNMLAFYRRDTEEKLLPPQELSIALEEQTSIATQERLRAEHESQRAEQEHQRAERESQRAEQAELEMQKLRDRLIALDIDLDRD